MEGYADTIPLYEQALLSAGTTQQKFNTYLESNEAALNRLKATLEGLWQSSFDSEAIRAGINILDGFVKVLKAVIENIGFFPTVIGLATASYLALNNTTRQSIMQQGLLSASLVKAGDSMKIASGAARAYQISLYNLTLAARGAGAALTVAGTAIRSIGTFLGTIALPTAAFMALGWAIGKVTEKIVEYNEKQRQIKQEAEQLANTYATNEEKIQSLADQYERLSNEVQKGLRPKDDEEYLKVQSELAQLIPTVVDHIDSKGQAHLRASKYVKEEIESIKELAKLESQNFVDNFDKKVDKVKSKIDDLQRQINNIKNPPMNAVTWKAGIPNELTTEDKIDIAIKQREINAEIERAVGLYKQYAQAYADYLGVKKQLNDADTEYINKLIEENKATLLTKKGREDLTKQIQEYIGKASEVRKVTGDLFSSKQIKKFTDDQISALKSVVNAVKKGNTDWDEHKEKLTKAGISAGVVSKTIKYLSGALNENKNAVKSNAISLEDLDEKLKEAKGDFDALAKIIVQLAKQGNYSQATTIAMTDAYQALADEVAPLNELLEKLAEGKQISAAEAMELIAKEHELAGAISIENGVVKVNREAVSKLRDAKVASYNDMLKSVEIEAKATANATLSKLRNYGIEIQAIQNLQDAKRRLAELEDLRNIANSGMGSWDTRDQINKAYEDVKSVVDLYENIQNLSSLVSTGLNQVGTSFENLSGSQDKSNKSTEKSIYVADKYQLALSKLNAEIQKIQSLQSKYPKHSESYRKALKQEIALLQQKRQLMQEQAKSLEQQIKSGKIQETGIISTKSTSVSGNSKEAIIWNFFKSKGFSDSVVAGILGNLKHESGLSTTIVNPTSGATGLAQWLGSRLTGLKRYAASLGRSWKDLDVQLNYMWKELNSTEKRTLNWLLRNQNADPTTVAIMFEKLFERAGGAGLKSRISYANQYYRKFANGNVSGDVSKQIAEKQQSIDQAKEDLNSLKAEISDLGTQISERYMEIHRSKIAEFDREREKLKNNIELYEMEKQALDESSEAYRQRIKNQMILERKSNKALQSEIKWAERQIKYDKNLSAADKDELRQFIAERQKMLRESNQQLAQWALDIHKSKIAEFDKDHERLENHIALYEQQKQLVDETSKKYRQITQNQIILENKKIASLKSEIAWAERQIKYDKNLDEAGKAFLREFIAERQKLLQESTQQVAQWQQDIIVSTLHELYIQIDKTFDAMEDRVRRLQHQLKMLGDTEFHPFIIGIMTDEIDALIKEREQTRKDLNRLKQEQKKLKKDSEPYKENLAKIAELEKRLMTIDENIIQADADLKDYYTRVAEQVIEAEKRYYEEKKRIALDALEKEREKIEEVYETEMKAIEDAHEARMRTIDEQLRALERLKETDDYNKQLNKLNKERQEILNQINKLALDDSQEANAKRMELQKQLAEKEDEINELKNNREYELRRQNLEDLREKLNEEYENERETREKSYEDLTENLDKRREEIEKYYDDIINNTRRWDNVTQQILSGQFNNLRAELNNIQIDIAKTMDSASNSVYELVKALEEAQKAMSSLGNNSKINYNEIHKQINEALDDPVYWDGAELKEGQIGRIKILKPINLWKRDAQGKLQFVRVLKPGEVFRVYGYDEKYGGQYNVGAGYWITNMKGYVQYETPSKEKLREAQMFNTGGYTGEDEGLAYLHKKEIVLNETDTKNFLDTVKELRSFDSMQILDSLKAATMSFMRIPKIQLPNLSPALAGGGTIQIDNLIHIDKVEKDANINIEKLADQAIDRLITKLKPYGFF